ncbi:CvpA family protein [Planctomycetota bacterium]
MLNICVFIIIAICVAMTWQEGLWTNAISVINALFSAIIASMYYEPLAGFLDTQMPTFTYFNDFLSLWFLYCFAFLFLRTIAETLSTSRVRFKLPVDKMGGAAAGLAIGWFLIMFFVFTIHVAPLNQIPFKGTFSPTPTANNFFVAPDRMWLGFLQSRSAGAMATSGPTRFDPDSEFILKYGERRMRFSKEKKFRVR